MSRYQTANEALAALEKRIAGLDWQNNEADRLKMREAIRDVVNNTSVAAEGKVTFLYSGEVNGVDSFKIARELKEYPNVRILDKTQAFALLSDRKFRDIQAKAFGFKNYGAMNDALKERVGGDANKYYGSPEKVFENDGLTGLWASISGRFTAETEGPVVIVTEKPRTNSVLVLTEVPKTLSDKSKVTTINSKLLDAFKKDKDPTGSVIMNAAQWMKKHSLSLDNIQEWLKAVIVESKIQTANNTSTSADSPDVTRAEQMQNPRQQQKPQNANNNKLRDSLATFAAGRSGIYFEGNVDNPYRVERHKVDDFLQRFANKKINDHHSLTESIRESITAITSHPTVAQAIDTIRNNSNPNLPVQVRARQLANESIDKLIQDGGSLSRHARQLRTDIEALTGVQESMGRMNEYQKAMLSQSASLRNDAEILAGISSKTSGIDAFENRANPIKIDDKLAVNARAMSTSTNSGPAPLSGSHSRMS